MLIAGCVLLVVAAAIHIMIFVLESVVWRRPGVWRMFGLRAQEQAEVMRSMAFNQGFYNLFLAGGAGAGAVALLSGLTVPGYVLGIFAAGCMVAAAIVLVAGSPRLWRAALVQGVAPAIAVLLLVLSLL